MSSSRSHNKSSRSLIPLKLQSAVRLTNVTWPPLRVARVREGRRGVERRASPFPPPEIGAPGRDPTGAPALGELLHDGAPFAGDAAPPAHLAPLPPRPPPRPSP